MTQSPLRGHVDDLLDAARRIDLAQLEVWGRHLARVLTAGGRLLVAGNGGSAAQAQHLTAELVGRYRDERQPLSAIPLTTDAASLTALGNDYGWDEVFARQVQAHGRATDVLLCLSTSGRSRNLLTAVAAARDVGVTTWAFTGPAANPLALAVDDALCADAASTAVVQEVHQVALHLLCEAVDASMQGAAGLQLRRAAS